MKARNDIYIVYTVYIYNIMKGRSDTCYLCSARYCLPIYVPTYLATHLYIYLLTYLSICLPIYLPAYLPACLPASLPTNDVKLAISSTV